MEIRISETIRSLRKERKMTQGQLAELFGVTVGAVSKWEAGLSIPDISIIVEMADYFETSVDVLLGYDWQRGSLGRSVENIKALRNEKRFGEAISLAEKSLQKYPNSFELTHACAVLFVMAGIEESNKKHHQRALALFERCLEMIGQNTNPEINEWTIKDAIANVYLLQGRTDRALALMKANNPAGINNGDIGYVLATTKKQPDKALPYLSEALIDQITRLLRICTAYANAYAEKKQYRPAISVLEWMYGVLDGLRIPGQISYLDRVCAQYLTALACLECESGRGERAVKRLTQALMVAEAFDKAPDNGFSKTRFYHSVSAMTGFDDFGASAVEGIERTLMMERENHKALALWKEITDGKISPSEEVPQDEPQKNGVQ